MKNRKQSSLPEEPAEPLESNEVAEAMKQAEDRAKYETQAAKDRNKSLDELEKWQAEQAAIEAKQRAETAKYIAALEEKDRKLKGAA